MDNFWNSFPGFVHNPQAPILAEFDRLAGLRGWIPGSSHFRRQRARCLLSEFTAHYGSAEERLAGWQALCYEVRIEPVPISITQCKKALNLVNVNIVDLIDARRTGEDVEQFPSRKALRRYSLASDKIFPKNLAKKNGFLKALLIRMFIGRS